MAIITCPECKQSISDQVEVCIHCGYPLVKPIAKLLPKMNQLWAAEQWQECLNVCNEILLINPKNYVAILRSAICLFIIKEDLNIGLEGYPKAVKVFEETEEISVEDADCFALDIRRLFSYLIGDYNKLQKVKSSLNELNNQVFNYQMAAPLGSKTSIASSMMNNDAKSMFKNYESVVAPRIEKWTRIIYSEFPQKLSVISSKGKETYDWIAKNAVLMNPALRQTIATNHSEILKQQDHSIRVFQYEQKKKKANQWLVCTVILAIFPIVYPMMRPDLPSSTLGAVTLVTWAVAACCAIPYFRVKNNYKDIE